MITHLAVFIAAEVKRNALPFLLAPFFISCASAEKFPDVTETPPLIRISETRTIVYQRPAWHRLLFSLRPYSETTANGLRARVTIKRVELTGSTDERTVLFAPAYLPTSYALGLTGGIDY